MSRQTKQAEPPVPEDDKRVLFFDGLQPIAFSAAIFGVIPVTWTRGRVEPSNRSDPVVSCFDKRKTLGCIPLGRAFRWASTLSVSFHPTRSTLPLTLTLCCLSAWSCYFMVVRRLQQLSEVPFGPETLGQRYIAVVSMVTGTSYVAMTPLLLLEAKRLETLRSLVQPLTDTFGFVLRPGRRSRGPEHAGMYGFQGCFFSSPFIVCVWIQVLTDAEYGEWSHFLVGVCQLQQVFILTTAIAGPPLCIADFARLLAGQLQLELSAPDVSAQRLKQYRDAWLDLRALLDRVLVMPVCSLAYMVSTTAFCSFMAYETSVAASTANVVVLGNILGYAMTWVLTILGVCVTADKGAESVKQCFLDVLLENGEQWRRNTEAKKELNMLTKIISRSEPSISMAGFFKLDKRTFASIITAVVTYVIVLLQFQQNEEQSVQSGH